MAAAGTIVNLRDDLNALTPRLRRFSRALMSGHPGGCERADDLVHATLMRALNARTTGLHSDLVIRLYATLTQLHRDIAAAAGAVRVAATPTRTAQASLMPMTAARQSRLTLGLMNLALEDREALVLVALEGFSHDEAARILHVTRAALLQRLDRARRTLDGGLPQTSESRKAAPARAVAGTHLRLVK